jgi:glucosyl-3-phosphoglycerate phosphatase
MSSDPRRLVLLRHGQTEWNLDGRMQGHMDTDLTEVGRSQAKCAARELAVREPIAIVSSDLRRARQTAEILAAECASPVPLTADPRLRETGLGQWEGLTHADVDAGWPGARTRWRLDPTMTPPGGENKVAVARRARPVVAELLERHPQWSDRPVVLVAHGGLIAALTASLLGLPVSNWPSFGGLANAGWVELSGWGEMPLRWRLEAWNASARGRDGD